MALSDCEDGAQRKISISTSTTLLSKFHLYRPKTGTSRQFEEKLNEVDSKECRFDTEY